MLLSRTFVRAAAWATGVTLFGFCAALVRLLTLPETPPCGCFGFFPASVTEAGREATMGLVRNGALLVLTVLAVGGRGSGDRATGRSGREEAGAPSATSRGFSLVEVLVAIGIIAVLIALSVPVLGRARRAAVFARSLSNQRQLVAAISEYAQSYAEMYPYLGEPGDPEAGLRGVALGDEPAPSYFGSWAYWPTALAVNGQEDSATLAMNAELTHRLRELYNNPRLFAGYYMLTHAASAAPDFWIPDDLRLDESLFRAIRVSEVRFPASKGLLADANEPVFPVDNDAWSVGLADGSAGYRRRDPIQYDDLFRPYGANPWSVLTTPHGVHGRDY